MLCMVVLYRFTECASDFVGFFWWLALMSADRMGCGVLRDFRAFARREQNT